MIKKIILASTIVFASILSFSAKAQRINYYLFYNIDSPHLDEIDISRDEVARIFDDDFGPAADELPKEVKMSDYYVAKYPDGSYVFMLDAPFNCGQLGCNTKIYRPDEDGDLQIDDSGTPVKCEFYENDKQLCKKAGYIKKKTPQKKKKGPIHYPAPPGNW